MQVRATQDTCLAVALIAIAVFVWTFLIPNFVTDAEGGAMSPRFFPRVGAILMGIGGIILLVISLFQSSSEADRETEPFNWISLGRTALVIAVLAGFILLFDRFGYFIAAPSFIAGLMLVFGSRNFIAIPLVAGVTTAVLFIVFSYGLNLPLI